MDIKEMFLEQESYIVEMRRWFHRHPEVSLKEKNTSQKIQDELTKMGIPFEVLAPNYGVIATIKGKLGEGKTLVLRADIDALPVTEDTGLDFASENPGVMHACGHDAHAAMLLGAAKVLNSLKSQFKGTIKCFFQIGEEIALGYEEALDYFQATGGIDGIAALHIWSAIPEGEILLFPGSVFAGGAQIKVILHGQGGHGSRPDLVKDPIKAACDLVLKLASIPSNFYDTLDHSVVSIGKIEAGTAFNIFPPTAMINGSLRYYKQGGEAKIKEFVRQITEGVCRIYGVDYELMFCGEVPPVTNNADLIQEAKELVKDVDGLTLSAQTDPFSASDDYGFFLQQYPGFYGVLGGGKPDTENYPQHHAKFDIDEKALRKGAEFMTRYALDFLR